MNSSIIHFATITQNITYIYKRKYIEVCVLSRSYFERHLYAFWLFVFLWDCV